MKKKGLFLFLVAVFTLSFSQVTMAKTDKLNIDVYNSFVVKKGANIKLVSNKKNIKWKSNSNKVKIKNKTILAKKTGKVVLKGKDKNGKTVKIKLKIKKKIGKASNKNVMVKVKRNNDGIDIVIENKSDECISANWVARQIFNEQSSVVSKKTAEVSNGSFPHIYINPHSKYVYENFSLNNYDLVKGKEYYIGVDSYAGNKTFDQKRHFVAKGFFVY